MDGSQCIKGRRVSRQCETNRLEEELWALAYEKLWPVLRRALSQSQAEPNAAMEQPSSSLSTNLIRSA